MEQQTKSENKEIATNLDIEKFTPDFDIKKFNENTYETMRVLYLHYFSKVLEENEKLKQPSYLCAWATSRGSFASFQKIVKANDESEAIKKFLFSCNESFEVIINDYRLYSPENGDIQRDDFMNKLINLGLLPVHNDDDSCFGWYSKLKKSVIFPKKYHEFLSENLDNAIYIFKSTRHRYFNIQKIDKDLIIE